MLRRKKKSKAAEAAAAIPEIDFKPVAADKQASQGVLIACRGIEQYPAAVGLLALAIDARADQILLDFSQQGAAVRIRVDGVWEGVPPMDRTTGDGALVIIKKLCGLNPQDRRNRQAAHLPAKYKENDWVLDFTSQGTSNGERVLIRIEPKKPALNDLADLGMREKMQVQLRGLLNSDDAMFIFSGAPGQGLPTAWRVGLESADRFVRDFHAIADVASDEPELINIGQHTFNAAAGETPMTVLKSLLLKQPDVLVLPDIGSKEVAELMCEEVIDEHRYLITRTIAPTAAGGLLSVIGMYKDSAQKLLKISCGVLNQRLVRRLCTTCREKFQPSPQLLAKLGIPAGRVQFLYKPTIPPPPEQRVDENGKPVEIEICSTCNGRGYYGRAAIFELLVVNDEIRKALMAKPDPAHITAVAKQHGFLSFQEEAVLAVATGLTSLQELQRIMTPPKKR